MRFLWLVLFFLGCTQEFQNKVGRSIQNWTGVDGVLDVISEGKVMYRFVEIDKLTTAEATSGKSVRPYRFGYGVYDTNKNYRQDGTEKKVYFEISDYGTAYVFYQNPFRRNNESNETESEPRLFR